MVGGPIKWRWDFSMNAACVGFERHGYADTYEDPKAAVKRNSGDGRRACGRIATEAPLIDLPFPGGTLLSPRSLGADMCILRPCCLAPRRSAAFSTMRGSPSEATSADCQTPRHCEEKHPEEHFKRQVSRRWGDTAYMTAKIRSRTTTMVAPARAIHM
jgi:hypothetical protein